MLESHHQDSNLLKNNLYKWLPIIFGCHCRNDRSFYYHDQKFPICSRCTGELMGIIFAIGSHFFFNLSVSISVCLMIPMLIDGFLQLKTTYESTNIRRVITGFIFGYSLCNLFIISSIAAYEFGFGLV